MKAIANSTPLTCGKTPEHKLIVLDFHEYGLEKGLEDLLKMARDGTIDGIVFSVSMTNKGGDPYLYGSSGRLSRNQAEAIGAAALLQNRMLTEFPG